MLLVTESAPSDQRGYYGAFAQAGAPVGVILANLAFITTSALVSEESFYAWGWRIPFLASAILIGISMYIQLNLEDTKAFKELQALRESQKDNNSEVVRRSPILEAIQKYPKRIALAAGAFLSIQVTFYILIAFLLAYGVASADITRDDMLAAVLIASAIMVPLSVYVFFILRQTWKKRSVHGGSNSYRPLGFCNIPTCRYRKLLVNSSSYYRRTYICFYDVWSSGSIFYGII